MHTIKLKIILILLALTSVSPASKAQGFETFRKHFSKYQLPEKIKYDCNWMYAIVLVETDPDNKIVRYKCLNEVSPELSDSFKVLIGFQFSKKIKPPARPLIFYFSIDNSEVCVLKPGDQITQPNDAINHIFHFFPEINKKYPNAIILPQPIIQAYYPTEK